MCMELYEHEVGFRLSWSLQYEFSFRSFFYQGQSLSIRLGLPVTYSQRKRQQRWWSLLGYSWSKNGQVTYCCDTPVSDNGNVVCPNNESSFRLDGTHAVPGRALLSNLSNFYVSGSVPSSSASPSLPPNSTASPSTGNSNTNHDVAIGVGVGVPLGVTVLILLVWAFLGRERAQASNAKLAAVISGEMQSIPPTGGYKMSRQNNHVLAELGSTQPLPAELEQTYHVAG